MEVINTKELEERKFRPEDVIALRSWKKGLIITDVYGDVFCLANKEYDVDAIFDLIVYNNNIHFFKNGNRYLNLDFVKDVKVEVKPAANVCAVKVLFKGGQQEVFNCTNETEARSFSKNIVKRKKDSQNALEI